MKIGEFSSSQGQNFEIHLTGGLRERSNLCFQPLGDDRKRRERLSFYARNGYFGFSGMLIDPSLRGLGLSADFLQIFIDLTEQMKARLAQTSVIRKPIIAKVLETMGAKAIDESRRVEILPTSEINRNKLPQITPLTKAACSLKSEDGKFFLFVDEEAALKYPLTNSETSNVHLYSPYLLDTLKNPSTASIEFSRRVLNSI